MTATFQHHRLSNQLEVVALPDDAAHTAAVGFFVRTGARDEQAALMGVSHFLEHMMFKSTQGGRTAEDVNREFDEMGANYNAFTSHEATVYYAHVLPEFLPRAVGLLGDMLRPALKDEDFNTEKNVILEEISMYEDRPNWRLMDALMEAHFGTHPLSFRVLGTRDTIAALTAAQMRGYFQQHYSADNITVAAAGKLNMPRLLEDLQHITASWRPTQVQRDYAAVHVAGKDLHLHDAKLNRQYLAMMCPAPSQQDDLRYAAGVLADVLGHDEGSRLYWALVDPGLADEADFSHLAQDQAGAYMAYVSCDPQRGQQVETILRQTLMGYAASIEPAEIERAKNKLATALVLRQEAPEGRMFVLGSHWMTLREQVPVEEEIRRYLAVTPEKIAALLQQYPFAPCTTVRLGPSG